MMRIWRNVFFFLTLPGGCFGAGVSSLEEGLDYALSEFDKSLSARVKQFFFHAIQEVVRLKDEEKRELEHGLTRMEKDAEESSLLIQRLTNALYQCGSSAMDRGQHPPISDIQRAIMQDFSGMDSAQHRSISNIEPTVIKPDMDRGNMIRRLKQTSLSFADMKMKFREAVGWIEQQFPGFKYSAKNKQSLIQQLEAWKKTIKKS